MSFKMNATAALFAATTLLGACAHHDSTTKASNDDYGRVDPAVTGAPATGTDPAIIAGPAKIDDTGRVYTSSAAGGAGNASSTGTNTNVNIVPEKQTVTAESSVTYRAAEPAITTNTTVVETRPAPIVVETEEAPSTMTSSTQETTTTTKRRRMSKD